MTPSIAVIVFSMTTSMLQILVQVAVFTGSHYPGDFLSATNAAGTSAKLYVALAAFDLFVVLFGVIFMLAVERSGGHRYSALPWIIWIIFYIIFESAVNIFYFTQTISINGISTRQGGYFVVPLVYWIVKDFILFVGWWCVVSRLCYWNHTGSGSGDTTLLLTQPAPTVVNGVGPTDSFGPMYYNGGATHVQIHDNPRSNCSHFEVARPPTAASCQVYSSNWGRNANFYGGNGGVNGGVYGQQRYIYTPN